MIDGYPPRLVTAVGCFQFESYGATHPMEERLVACGRQSLKVGLSLLAHPDKGDIDRILDTLVARRVDGIVWAVPEVGSNRLWINPTRLDRLPPIVFLSMKGQTGLAIVSVDNRAGARQAVQHLIDQGRRRIGLITGPLAWWEARERFPQ